MLVADSLPEAEAEEDSLAQQAGDTRNDQPELTTDVTEDLARI